MHLNFILLSWKIKKLFYQVLDKRFFLHSCCPSISLNFFEICLLVYFSVKQLLLTELKYWLIPVIRSCLSSLIFEVIIWINSEFRSPSSGLGFLYLVSGFFSLNKSNNVMDTVKYTVKYFNILIFAYFHQTISYIQAL